MVANERYFRRFLTPGTVSEGDATVSESEAAAFNEVGRSTDTSGASEASDPFGVAVLVGEAEASDPFGVAELVDEAEAAGTKEQMASRPPTITSLPHFRNMR